MNSPHDWRQALPALATPSLRQCSNLADLTAIFDEDAQIAIHPRPSDQAIVDWLEAAARRGVLGNGFRGSLRAGERLAADLLPDLPGREHLAADISELTEIHCELLGCPGAGLRLELVADAMCPRFHVDRVGLRMLCTYRGPGTEWLDDSAADRRLLGRRAEGVADTASGLILDPAAVRVVPPFAIALLKGSLWQGNAERGIIHRSPAVAMNDAPRVLLAIDALWD